VKVTVQNVPAVLTQEGQRMLTEELVKARDQTLKLYRSTVVKKINETQPFAPVDTGTLRTGIWSMPLPLSLGRIEGWVIPSPVSQPYAVVMELGRRPGRPGPPLAPILAWVKRKGLAGTFSIKRGKTGHASRRRVGGAKTKAAQDMRAAVAIRKSIHEKGTKGRFFFRRAKADTVAREKARGLVQAAIRRWKRRLKKAGGPPKGGVK